MASEQRPANDTQPAPRSDPRPDDGRLGRDKPGEGLDTGVDTGALNPGQTGNNGQADKN